MRTTFSLAIPVALLASMLPAPARAITPLEPPPFSEGVVPDEELALHSGTFAGVATSLNSSTLNAVIDADVRAWFRATSDISGVEMDVWWTSTGTDMIAANMRSQEPSWR